MDVTKLQDNPEFQEFLYQVNDFHLKGIHAVASVDDIVNKVGEVNRAVGSASQRGHWEAVKQAVWATIQDTILYRIYHQVPEPYVPGNTEDSVPDVYADAVKAVSGPRNKDYGSVFNNFSEIVRVYMESTGNIQQVDVWDVPIFLIAVKLGRLKHTPKHYDSLVDIIGYCLCMFQLIDHYEQEAYATKQTDKLPRSV